MKVEFTDKPQDGWPITKVLARHESGAYVIAEVMAVHTHKCKAWRPSAPRHGWKCSCGADRMFDAIVAKEFA